MMGVNASFFALEGFHDNFFPKMEDDENLMFPWVDIHVPIAPLTEADLDHLAALAWSDHWAAIAWSVLATLADSLPHWPICWPHWPLMLQLNALKILRFVRKQT